MDALSVQNLTYPTYRYRFSKSGQEHFGSRLANESVQNTPCSLLDSFRSVILAYGNEPKWHHNTKSWKSQAWGHQDSTLCLGRVANFQYKMQFTISSKCLIYKASKITLFITRWKQKGIILNSKKQSCLYDSLDCSMILSI